MMAARVFIDLSLSAYDENDGESHAADIRVNGVLVDNCSSRYRIWVHRPRMGQPPRRIRLAI